MGKIEPDKSDRRHWRTGLLALGLFVLSIFYPAVINVALWLVHAHDHEHQIVVRADGDHFDILLSHDHDLTQPAANHDHESPVGLIVSLFSSHEHEGNDHVLHFNLSEAPDPIRQRNQIAAAPTPAQTIAIATTSLIKSLPASTPAAAAIQPSTSPPLTAGLLGLRTTVLLI